MTTVRDIRERTGLTQEEFANKYGIPFGTLADWEIGRHEPQEFVVDLLKRFAAEDADENFKKPIMYGVGVGRLLDMSKMTKAEFAKAYNIKGGTVRRWKKNERSWKIDLLERAVREDMALR